MVGNGEAMAATTALADGRRRVALGRIVCAAVFAISTRNWKRAVGAQISMPAGAAHVPIAPGDGNLCHEQGVGDHGMRRVWRVSLSRGWWWLFPGRLCRGFRWMQWMETVRSTDGILEGEQGKMPDQKMQGKALQQSRWRKFKGRE